uniref:Uncharacterized protein n=1 Tax=Rhizophora mucronata TaxID=61149 RepID=A0A2P2J451_RHIMU
MEQETEERKRKTASCQL